MSSSNLDVTAGPQIFVVHMLGTHFRDGQCRGTKKYKVPCPLLQCLKQVRIGVWIHIPIERKANATRSQVQTPRYRCTLAHALSRGDDGDRGRQGNELSWDWAPQKQTLR